MSSSPFGLAGIIGWPVAHSRSPSLHNYWLQKYGLNGAYVQPVTVLATGEKAVVCAEVGLPSVSRPLTPTPRSPTVPPPH